MDKSVSIILLAGGSGSRMGTPTPKQFLPLAGKPIAVHSFDLLSSLDEVGEVVVVCAHEYRHHFAAHSSGPKVTFADPGLQRQDSVYNGLLASSTDSRWLCIHDAARPLVTLPSVRQVLTAAFEHGAAALAVPAKATVKLGNSKGFVERTLNRSELWEMQTPQVALRSLLVRAYRHALAHKIAVTDDMSLIEALGEPVKLVEGSYSNIKITTPEDLLVARQLTEKTRHTRIGVYGVVVRNDNILLVEKGPNGPYAGLLDLPGGGIEFGETPEQALRREFAEEVAMSFDRLQLWDNLSATLDVQAPEGNFEFHHLGQVYHVDGVQPIAGTEPMDHFHWTALAALEERTLTPFAAQAVKQWKQ